MSTVIAIIYQVKSGSGSLEGQTRILSNPNQKTSIMISQSFNIQTALASLTL